MEGKPLRHTRRNTFMSDPITPATDAEVLQILMNEHMNLQAIRSATTTETTGRTTIYIGAVSSALVAIAFIGQVLEMSQSFFVFTLILVTSLLYIGIVTFLRVYQSGLEDTNCSRGINRIRHYYTQIAPQLKPYFILSDKDDMKGMLRNLAVTNSPWQMLVSAAGLVSVINSILVSLAGVIVVSMLVVPPFWLYIIAAIVFFIASMGVHTWVQEKLWEQNEAHLKVLFPSRTEETSP
jgi:hypothetical protein